MSKLFDKLMEKKKHEGKGHMRPEEKKAKVGILEDLKNAMSEHMSGKLGGLKKVTVASDSKEGLKKGLEKAKEITGHMPEGEGEDEESPVHEASESVDEEAAEHEEGGSEEGKSEEDMSPDEIKAEIRHLEELLKQKL